MQLAHLQQWPVVAWHKHDVETRLLFSLLCAPLSCMCGTPSDRRGLAAAGGNSGRARQARFLWDPAQRGGVFDNIEAELALRVAALASGPLPSAV
jgi:hypothetical protein